MELRGIDVSAYQGVINWLAVKRSGISWASMKATEGTYGRDPQFPRNWQRSKLRGVRRMAYHFLKPSEDGWAQADFFHQFVHDSGKFEIGDAVQIDLEDMDGQDPSVVVQCAERFAANILQKTHCGVYLYTGPYFWNDLLGSPSSPLLHRCPLWTATYGPAPGQINGWPGPSIWQWGSESVPGIVGDVDADIFYGSQHAYDALSSQGGRH